MRSLQATTARPAQLARCRRRRGSLAVAARRSGGRSDGAEDPSASDRSTPEGEPSPGAALKVLWYAAEAFGDAVGLLKRESPQAAAALPAVRLSREEALAALRADYSEDYFISGRGDLAAYDKDCVFADPFVSFSGTARFKKNVSNLGGLMKDVRLNIKALEERGDDVVQSEWSFSCVLDLPWKPRLAAAGGTTHVFSLETGRVVKHIERWDIEPAVVVKQLFTPGKV